MPIIDRSTIVFEKSSLVDPIGRVFRHEERVYRLINNPFVEDTKKTLEMATRQNWFAAGLVNTAIADIQVKGYELILEHRRIPYSTYRGEWSAAGLKRAALSYLNLCICMLKSGYCLKDSHTFNVLFDGAKFVFIDFGSVAVFSSFSHRYWLNEFFRSFLAPLLIFSKGDVGLARSLTQEHGHGVGGWLLRHDPDRLIDLPNIDCITPDSLEKLIREIESLQFPTSGGDWNCYMEPDCAWREKDHQLVKALDGIDFTSVLDIGANRGLHASICARRGANVLACDIEEACLNAMFDMAEHDNLPITPLYMDITRPLGSGGVFCSQPAATERLRCDLVIALALVHHVCFRQRFYVDAVVQTIANFSKDAAVVEFVPDYDVHVKRWGLPPLADYTREGFGNALRARFEQVEDFPFSDYPRRLFVCRGKRA